MRATDFQDIYDGLLLAFADLGPWVTETNERTGVRIRVLPGGHSFLIDLREGRIPVPGNRRYYPHVAAAETAWQMLGTKDARFILRHAPKLWSKFTIDGVVHEPSASGDPARVEAPIVETAYGWRWRRRFGRDQLRLAISALRRDRTNRQVWVQAWDPARDGLGAPDQPKNIPCPIGFAVNIVGGRLHGSVFIRSSDVFVGLPYDVMCYAMTLDAIACSVGVRLGSLHVTLAHAHVYEPHWADLERCVHGDRSARVRPARHFEPGLPRWDVDEIAARPDDYVATVRAMSVGTVKFNDWDPKPVVVE